MKSLKRFFSPCENSFLDLALVVRAILGCCYKSKREDEDKIKKEKGIKNCLIRMLNSSNVDVDKLDYIARDTQMSGYDNIVLDTERLLNAVCMVCADDMYYPAFKKSALSVINNVVLAKNLQAKWIINHPVVIYESNILRRAIGETLNSVKLRVNEKEVSGDELIKFIFSSLSLSKEGNKHDRGAFNLLSDVEILSLMKEKMELSSVSEYFSRNERKSPIWKSHEEFEFCLGVTRENREKACEVANFVRPLLSHLNDVEDLGHAKEIGDLLYNEISTNEELEKKEDIIKILDVLKSYKDENGSSVDFNYVLLSAKNKFFTRKIDEKKLYIQFDDTQDGYTTYDKFESNYANDIKPDYQFFYLYSKSKLNAKHFLEYLYSEAHKSVGVRV